MANLEIKLKVTSLTRSFEDQKNLRRRNANATDPLKSPHVRGAGIGYFFTKIWTLHKKHG